MADTRQSPNKQRPSEVEVYKKLRELFHEEILDGVDMFNMGGSSEVEEAEEVARRCLKHIWPQYSTKSMVCDNEWDSFIERIHDMEVREVKDEGVQSKWEKCDDSPAEKSCIWPNRKGITGQSPGD